MEASIYYIYEIVPSATAYRSGGYVDYRMQNLSMDVADIRGGGGGFSVNYSAINSHTTSKSTELKKYIDEKVDILKENHKEIYDKVNETDSHIELAKDEVIDTIKAIETQEIDEKEAKKAIKLIQGVDKKLTSYIESESSEKSQEDEKEMKIEELIKKLEKNETLIEDMEKTAQEIIDELEKERENAKTLAKKDIISSLSE